MSDEILIEQMQLSDRDAVLEFLAAGYPDNPRQSNPAFWNWHFVDHPLSQVDRPPVWLARSGNRIAGQLACIPVDLWYNGETIPSAWILDLMIDPEFRRRGIMKMLVRAIHARYRVLLGVNTNEQHAPAGLIKVGWHIVGRIPRYHKLLYPGNDIRQFFPNSVVTRTINAAFAPFRPRLRGMPDDVRLVTEFDTSFEELWAEARGQWKCAVQRNVDTLNWQFRDQPGKRFDIVAYYRDRKLRGYAVLFFRKAANGAISKAAVSDICYSPDDRSAVIDSLIHACLQLAVERRCGGLVIDIMDPVVENRLRHAGFWKINSPLQLMAWSSDNDRAVADPASWFLTRGDSDISIFEAPNIDQ